MTPSEKTQSREFCGGAFAVHVTKLPATRALRLQARLVRLLVPPLAKAVGGQDVRSLAQMRVDMAKVGAALGELVERVTEKDLDEVMMELLAHSQIVFPGADGKAIPLTKAVIDQQFTGELGELLKLIAFGFEVQFGPFSGGLRDSISRLNPEGLLEKFLRASQETASTNGQPGDSGLKGAAASPNSIS